MKYINTTIFLLLLFYSGLVNAIATYSLIDSIQAYLDGVTWVTKEKVEKKVYWPSFEYQGAFMFNSGEHGEGTLHDTEGSIAFKTPTASTPNGSLFVASRGIDHAVAEFAIPDIVNSTNLAELNESTTPLQSFVNIVDAPINGLDVDMIGSMIYENNNLIFSAHRYYPASNKSLHGVATVRNASSLVNSQVDGYVKIDTTSPLDQTAEALAGWFSPIPIEWQTKLGGTHLFGPNDGWSVSGRNTYGPATFAVNLTSNIVNDSTLSAVIPSTPIVDYNDDFELDYIYSVGDNSGGSFISPPSDLWSTMSFVHFGFIPKGSRSLILLGEHFGADGDIGYKIVQEDTAELKGGPAPFKASDSYNYYWMFDLDDLVAIRESGNDRVPVPYAYGKLDLPFQQGREGPTLNSISGGAYDLETGTLYLTIKDGDYRAGYEIKPVFISYKVNTAIDYYPPMAPTIKSVTPSNTLAESGDITVNWEPVQTNTNGENITVAEYRVFFRRTPVDTNASYERYRGFGVTVSGGNTSLTYNLGAGSWDITVKAITDNNIPSELATMGDI